MQKPSNRPAKMTKTAKNKTVTVSNILILFLAVIAGLIHLFQPDTLLKMTGIGYIVLAAGAVFTLKRAEAIQQVAPKMLIAYAVITLSMYFVLNGTESTRFILGMMSKVMELMLLVALINGQVKQKKAKKAAWVARAHPYSNGMSRYPVQG